jgi:hypothetical protein
LIDVAWALDAGWVKRENPWVRTQGSSARNPSIDGCVVAKFAKDSMLLDGLRALELDIFAGMLPRFTHPTCEVFRHH